MDEVLNFKPCKADPDLWLQPALKDDGTPYYEYVLLYVDDILAIGLEPKKFIKDELGKLFTIKEKSIGPPTQYLGNKVSHVDLDTGVSAWSFSSSQYIQNAVKNIEETLAMKGEKLLHRAKAPWPSNYMPETDITPMLSPESATYYQSLIGILRWIVELG